MPYGRRSFRRRRTSGFRRTRGRYATRPTAYRKTRVSWWKRRRARSSRKYLNPNTTTYQLLKLPFADSYVFDCGAATYTSRDFRLNSLYDPDATGVGGTPSCMTQYAQLYKSYKVLAAKVTCTVWNTGTVPAVFGMTAQSDEYILPSTGRGLEQLAFEAGSCKYCITQPASVGERNMSTVRWFGRIRPLLGERYASDNSCASIGGNPAKVAHLYPFCIAPDGATTGAKVSVAIRIVYYCKLFNNNPARIVD